jgi:hypothetical protein
MHGFIKEKRLNSPNCKEKKFQKERKKEKQEGLMIPFFFCLHPFLSASWIQYLQIVAD